MNLEFMNQLSSSDIIALSSAIIALAALFTAIWQGYLNRRHFRLSVRPRININTFVEIDPERPFAIEIKNQGLGPAIIGDIFIISRGEIISANGHEEFERALSRAGADDLGNNYHIFNITDGTTLLQGERITWLSIVGSTSIRGASMEAIKSAFNTMGIFVRYYSLYGEELNWNRNLKWHFPIQLALVRLTRRYSQTNHSLSE